MRTSTLLAIPAVVAATGATARTVASTHGVPPELVTRYAPSADGKWACLSGGKTVAWKAVNDDYCDCPDGSDEPGACYGHNVLVGR
jgi:protein kinase C substrate 80K-H